MCLEERELFLSDEGVALPNFCLDAKYQVKD